MMTIVASWTLLLLLSAFSVVNSVILNPEIVVRPADDSGPKSKVFPLTCVATSDGGDPIIIRWRRRFEDVTTSVSATPVAQTHTSSDGRAYTISTLQLCNLDFNDVGTYVCDIVGTNEEEVIQVGVHIPSSANFQLRLSGVGTDCGGWVSSSSDIKLQSIVDHLQNNVLNNICTDQQCSYNITNFQFNCVNDLNSNGVTFQARIDHRLQVESFGQDANDVVSVIGTWKDTSPSLVISSQSLRVESSCDVDSFTVCGTSTDGGGGGGGGSSVGPAVGGIVGAIVFVCVIIAIIVLVIVIMQRYGNKRLPVSSSTHSATNRQFDKDYAHTDFNMSYGVATETLSYKEKDNGYTYYNPNASYGASNSSDPRRPSDPQHPSGGRKNVPLLPTNESKVEYYTSIDVKGGQEMYEDIVTHRVTVAKDVKGGEEMYDDIVTHQVTAAKDYEEPVETSHVDDKEMYDYVGDCVSKM